MFQQKNLYIIYWTIGCLFVGVLVAPLFYDANPQDHSTHYNHDHSMLHGKIEVNPKKIPEITISVTPDTMAGWNLSVKTKNFTFTPEKVNQTNVLNEGHAHIYIDGVKLTRLYGTSYHISDLSIGEHEISVSLNANDHSDYVLNGKPIVAKQKITQKPKEKTK